MKLYYHPLSPNSRKVLAAARHLGVAFDGQVVDFAAGDLRTPEFLAINPNGMVPALVDGDLKLSESNAIMAYLASKGDTPLWPKTNDRYEIIRWFSWEAAHWQGQAIGPVAFERLFKPMLGAGTPDAAVVDRGLAAFARFAGVLNTALEGKRFLLGEQVTLADFAVGAPLAIGLAAQLSLADYPNVARWNQSLDEVPAWKETAPKMG